MAEVDYQKKYFKYKKKYLDLQDKAGGFFEKYCKDFDHNSKNCVEYGYEKDVEKHKDIYYDCVYDYQNNKCVRNKIIKSDKLSGKKIKLKSKICEFKTHIGFNENRERGTYTYEWNNVKSKCKKKYYIPLNNDEKRKFLAKKNLFYKEDKIVSDLKNKTKEFLLKDYNDKKIDNFCKKKFGNDYYFNIKNNKCRKKANKELWIDYNEKKINLTEHTVKKLKEVPLDKLTIQLKNLESNKYFSKYFDKTDYNYLDNKKQKKLLDKVRIPLNKELINNTIESCCYEGKENKENCTPMIHCELIDENTETRLRKISIDKK